MRIAILGDTHHGMRNDNLAFHNHYKKFYEQIFFPYLQENNIKQVIQVGDMFDRKKFINYNTFHLSEKYFFSKFDNLENNLILHTFPGNHDIYFRRSLEVNSISLLLGKYISKGIVNCYIKPTTVIFDGIPIDFIPWVCEENYKEIKNFIENTKSQICFGHFEIQGFEQNKGNISTEGWDRKDLDKYEMVISGHFHHRSSDGHIYYVGAPGEMTWADYDDPRGFHIFDTQTRELEFVENPFKIHHKILYEDTNETLETIMNKDYGFYKDAIVKVVILSKNNPTIFDMFMDRLWDSQPLDISIVEDFSDTNISDEDVIDQADDTPTLISKVIDSIDTELDKEKLKNIVKEIYLDALNFESTKEVEI